MKNKEPLKFKVSLHVPLTWKYLSTKDKVFKVAKKLFSRLESTVSTTRVMTGKMIDN